MVRNIRTLFQTNPIIISSLLAVLMAPGLLWSYDQIDVHSVVPINTKKPHFSTLRLDANNQTWVLEDKKQLLLKIDEQGNIAKVIEGGGKKAPFKKPSDFDFDRNGNLIIADEGMNRVVVFGFPADSVEPGVSRDWEKAEILSEFPVENPSAIAISGDGVFAVAIDKGRVVNLYSLDGVLLHSLIPPPEKEFDSVNGLGFSPNGTVYVLDEGSDLLHRFSPDRKWLGVTSSLEKPESMSVDSYGYSYVVTRKGKIFEINDEGKTEGVFGTKGKARGQINKPTGIDITNSGLIWVAEDGNERFQSFQLVNSNKKTPQAPQPVSRFQVRKHKALSKTGDRLLFGPDGFLYLVNHKKRKAEAFNKDGRKMKSLGRKGKKEKGFGFLSDISFGPDGNAWGADEKEHKLKKLDEKGEISDIIGEKSRKQGGLKDPNLITVRKDGSFIVVDKGFSRVQVFGKKGLFLFEVGTNGDEKGQFETVTAMAANEDRIAIVDNKRKALLFFDKNGKFTGEISNQKDSPDVWFNLSSISADKYGRFFVMDRGAGRIRIFTSMGGFLADLTVPGLEAAYDGDGLLAVRRDKNIQLYSLDFIPEEVPNLNAKDDSGILHISWDASPSCREYKVYKSSGSNPFFIWTTTTTTELFDDEVNPGEMFSYGIRGVSQAGYEGNWSQTKPLKPSRRTDISLVSISDAKFSPVFTAAFKYYASNPIGEVSIQNNDDRTHRNVKVSLTLKRYTDYATEKVLNRLAPGEKATIPMTMTFNDKVLELTENTPVQVDVKVSYFENNEERSFSRNQPLTLYSRNAIIWNNKSRISSFVTPRDEPIVEFSRQAMKAFLAEVKGATVGQPLAKAALMYESLNALNMSYVPDPKTPFTEVAGNPEIIDYVQFPRETLRRKTGDCDDTTALLASLLESVGVETALVDTPGHIFLMAGLDENDPEIIGLPEERFVEFQSTLWVPIETTKLGKNFLEAWKTAKNQIEEGKEKGKLEYIPILRASRDFPPVTLVEKEKNPTDYPDKKVEGEFKRVLEKLEKEKYESALARIQKEIKEDPDNAMLQIRLGMVHVEGGKVSEGKKIFSSLVSDGKTEVQSAAHNNLGNLAYLSGDFNTASKHYLDAGILSPDDGGIYINRARTAWKMGNKTDAKKFLYQAKDLMTDWREYAKDLPSELMPK